MEVILEQFFQNFGELERNSLHASYKRKWMVEYFNRLILGCSQGEQCDTEKTCKEAVISILRYHEKTRDENGAVCIMGKFHNILYVAIKLCYDWQLKDSATVATLLDSIYYCEKTFERIWIGALFGTKAPHYISGWKSDFESQEENLRAVVYFLDHANNCGAEYPRGQRTLRFIDVPIESCGKSSPLRIAVLLGHPDKLHMLLRFGAQVIDSDNEMVVDVLLERLAEFRKVYPYNLLACLQLFARVLPEIKIDRQGGLCADLIKDGIVPLTRCGIVPAELKHLCRCAVRDSLWRNFQLPNGIADLPVPQTLKRYLDLMED